MAAAAVLVLGACGSDDTDDASGDSAGTGDRAATSTTAAASGAVEGCEDALSDIDDVDPDDPPGRCEPGSPAPQPLDETATIRLGMSNTSLEIFAAPLVALEAGEFERENLDVEIHTVPSADSPQLLADGQLDAIVSSPQAGIFNGIAQGFNIRWVAGRNRGPKDTAETALWVRKGTTVEDLPGRRIATGTGPGSNAFLALYESATEAGVDYNAIEFVQIADAQNIITALLNGAVDGGIVSPPFHEQLEADGGFEVLARADTVGEAGGGILFGPTMLENREVGEAFLRAYVRTISTYFVDGYESDPEMVELMAATLDVPADVITNTPEYTADYEIHRSLIDRLQRLYFAAGVSSYGEDDGLTDADVVDRSFLEAAVGSRYGS